MACSSELLLHAEDAAIIVFHDEKDIIEAKLSGEIEGDSKWFIDNMLSMHLGKPESILFGSSAKVKKVLG